MVEIDIIKEQIAQAKQNVQTERQLVEQKRQEAKKVEESIRIQEKKIPKPTQRLIRSGMYSGLEGRKRRRQVESMKKELSSKGKEVSLFKGELTKYEEEKIKPFEEEIGQIETEVIEYERQESALNLAEKVYLSTAPGAIFMLEGNQLALHYYGLLKQGEKVEITPYNDSNVIEQTPQLSPFLYPKGTFDVKTKIYTNISGEKQSMATSDALNIGATFFSTPSSSISIPSIRDLPRIDALKNKPLMSIDFPRISQQTSSIFDIPFRTTGSPMRITGLMSSNSRGHQTIKQPIRKQNKFIKLKQESKKLRKKFKGRDLFGSDEDFLFSKKKIKKKKSNIWGI